MKYAQTNDGTRVSADYALKGNEYHCPGCLAPLVLKQGQINAWHFAHKNDEVCDAFTENKMTQWHLWHQEEFPEEYREVRLEDPETGRVYIADIKCGDLIVEFQHSPIDNETFEDRSVFYSSFGRLVWVFDFRDKYDRELIWWRKSRFDKNTGCFCWDYPNKMLGEYHLLGCAFDVFIQLHEDLYVLVEWNPRGMKYFNGRQFTHAEFMEYLRNVFRGVSGIGGLRPRRINYQKNSVFMYNFTDGDGGYEAGCIRRSN